MQLKNKVLLLHHQNVIELWCNGNTTDSGPVILGSNPGSSTEKRGIILAFFHFIRRILLFRFAKRHDGPAPLIDTAAKTGPPIFTMRGTAPPLFRN